MSATPDILVTHNPRLHACVVTWRPDLPHTVSPLPGGTWNSDGNSWRIPTLDAWHLLSYFREQFPHLRVSFDKPSAAVIVARLERESATTTLSLAPDGDVPNVLSVPFMPFQRAGIAFGLHSSPRKLFAMPTGTGKTAMACGFARIRNARTLWVTKAALVSNLTREIRKLTGQRAIQLLGTIPSPDTMKDVQRADIQHFVISYDALSRDVGNDGVNLWALALGRLANFDLLVVDEAHNMKSRKTNRWKVVKQLESIPAVLFLTATPIVNNASDMFALMNILAPDVFPSESEFFRAYATPDGKLIVNPKKLHADLLPFMFRRTREQVMPDLPPKVRQQHEITLSDFWQKRYDDVLDKLYTALDGAKWSVGDGALAEMTRFRQVVAQAKVEHTVEHARTLEESGEKVLIFTKWHETADAIAKELFAPCIHGGKSAAERLDAEQQFQQSKSCRFLVGTFDTMGEGLTLTEGTAIIFNDYDWTPRAHEQAEGRAWGRLNNMHGALIYYVHVKDTVDQHMTTILERKQALIDAGVDGQQMYAEASKSMLGEFLTYLKEHR